MELGGNAPFIVFESANIEKAVQVHTLGVAWRHQGEAILPPRPEIRKFTDAAYAGWWLDILFGETLQGF